MASPREAYTVGDSAGVCVWEPSGTWKLAVREQIALLPAMLRIFGRNLPRLLGTLNAVEKNHPTEPHHYLAFVGVDPESQRQGMGSILMHPVLQRCDAEGLPAYLEASAPRNRALYERHGFEATEEIRPGRGRTANVANVEGPALTSISNVSERAHRLGERESRPEQVENLLDVVLDQEVAGVLHPDGPGGLKSLDPVLGVRRGCNRVFLAVNQVDGEGRSRSGQSPTG